MKKEELLAAIKDFNENVGFDPAIKGNKKSTLEALTESIESATAELEDGDTLNQSTVDLLLEMELDVPAKLKIKGKAKAKPKGKKASDGPNLKTELDLLLKEKKHTQKELKDILVSKFPEKSLSTITTLLSDCKNPKWNPLPKLAKVDSKGIMKY